MKNMKKLLSLLLTFTVMAAGFVPAAMAAGGDEWTPVSTAEELQAMAQGLGGSYYLTDDIDLTGVSWTPVGAYSYAPFTGNFDGSGHTITGLTVNNAASGQSSAFRGVGLFGVCSGATIEDLYVLDADVTNTGTSNVATGIITGICYNTTIRNCVTTGSVSSKCTWGTGGIAGYAWISSGMSSTSGEIWRCASSAEVSSSSSMVGGIIGNTCCPVSECYFTGSATSSSGNVGGIAGRTTSTVSDCWTSGSVEGKQNGSNGGVGGIVGSGGTVTNCYTYAEVNATATSFSTTTAAGRSGQPAVGSGAVTGVYFEAGHFYDKGKENTDWDFYYNGSYLNGEAKSYDQMTDPSTFQGWDTDIWLLEDGDYPQLIWAPSLTPAPPQPSTEEYTVTFDSGSHTNGDFAPVESVTVTVEAGDSGTITLPDAPENRGEWVYVFLGWSDGATLYDAGERFTADGDIELTAVWQLYSIDGDGEWTYLDAMELMDSLAGMITLAPEQEEISDRNNDGEVTYLDAMAVMDALAGTI